MRLKRLATIAGLCLCGAPLAHAAASFTAPVPYLQASDIPYPGPWQYFHLESFEDGLVNTPD